MKRLVAIALLAVLVAVVGPAHATVDGYLTITTPYSHLETGDVCFMKSKMWAVFGIPAASAMQGILKPVYVYKQNTDSFVNVNLAATTPAMVGTYNWDGMVNGVYEYRMTLNVTALRTAKGTTVTGRTATIHAAKLALLSMARSLSDITDGRYRLRVTFVGLPSQSGLAGTYLYSSTTSPYTGGSPLLAAYEAELVNQNGSCGE
jgi:hypothetical protein